MKEFTAACSQTRKLDIGDITLAEDGMAIDQTVLNAVEATGHIPFPLRAENGFNVNFGMFHMLAKKFHIPGATMTLGNVAVNGEMRFPAELPHFKKMLKEQSGEENMGQYHLWTTLPGGYILDHAIMSGLHRDGIVEVNEAVPTERYLYGKADELPHGLTYHPMIVGLEFFVASGTIDQEALEYLMGERFPKQY
ncbi:hypothetical protein [Pseudodesulfovibrio sp. zrk46]|uniref:hypothetical protein n=1 Tax=Pseudodesulfovibrio sp. zrk46 TaxID=2725288 RepID=UPI001FFDA6A0|nr:hypothetical protein [Pseudodesulfovibrio sp. zrk46]